MSLFVLLFKALLKFEQGLEGRAALEYPNEVKTVAFLGEADLAFINGLFELLRRSDICLVGLVHQICHVQVNNFFQCHSSLYQGFR